MQSPREILSDIWTSAGGEAFALSADITQREEAEMLVDETVAHFGSIDILVNNAGIWKSSPIEEMSDGEWDEIHEKHIQFMKSPVGKNFRTERSP